MSDTALRPDATDPDVSSSQVSLSVVSGGAVTLWSASAPLQSPKPETEVQLDPDRPAVIGRWFGSGEIPYLDPAYQSTPIVPETGQSILRQGGSGDDICVSRGHFMLRVAPSGILLVNGVPRRGGGIRPPLNGTWLLSPVKRRLEPGEEYLIERPGSILISLPNGSRIQIAAR